MNVKLWQNRFYEHCIRDECDYQRHLDYIHYNPIKHGHVNDVNLWRWSSFKRYQQQGLYPKDWGIIIDDEIKEMDFE